MGFVCLKSGKCTGCKYSRYDEDEMRDCCFAEHDAKELAKKLNEASTKYYNGKESGISDREWDQMFDELKELEHIGVVVKDSPTQRPGAEAVTELKKVHHEHPALSLDKVKYKDREDMIKWLDHKEAVMSWKCDGLTVVATYDNGSLTSAVTRGNGEEGSVITHNAKFFLGLPQEIPYKGHLVVRGEAMITFAEFERINAENGGEYENPRNLAAATIQMLDANESRKRAVIFKAFELVTPAPSDSISVEFDDGKEFFFTFMSDRHDFMKYLGFDVVDHEIVTEENILERIEFWKEYVNALHYPTDGLVISYNNMVYGLSLGNTGHHFRHSIALKWTDETVSTTIRDIEWSVGKTGIITPVAIFDEVRLGLGSNVTRASLHNLSIMKRKLGNPYIGQKIRVYLANMIIPEIEGEQDGRRNMEEN